MSVKPWPAALPDHDCDFIEVEITEDDEDDNLRAGMKVLIPCPCGETPLDHLSMVEMEAKDALAALAALDPRRALFHWAPATRRKQITRFGLRPRMRPTTVASEGATYKAPVICLGDSPSWAWALSGDMSYTPPGEWDLWQTALDLVTEPFLLPSIDRASGIHEIRTEHRIYKRDLWWVGSRVKG